MRAVAQRTGRFPFLFGGTFIEGKIALSAAAAAGSISLPFRRDFH